MSHFGHFWLKNGGKISLFWGFSRLARGSYALTSRKMGHFGYFGLFLSHLFFFLFLPPAIRPTVGK